MSTPKTIYATGLDAGSAWTRTVILELDGDLVRYRGHGEVESQGWAKGQIADHHAVSAAMLAALHGAEQAAGVSVESAVVGVGGSVRGANSRGLRDLGKLRTVEQRDINAAVERATRVRLAEGRMILQLFPQDFVVDGHPGHRNPRKMIAGQIEANVHLVTTPKTEHDVLVAAVNQAHLAVEETVFEALAACYAAVRPEERTEGFALLNIGAHTAELVVFHGEAMHLACSLQISGDHFTRDVAQGLCISLDDAVAVKHEFGCAKSDTTSENSFVEVPSREDREAPRRTLNRILEARAVELFQHVRRELIRVSMDGGLLGGLYLAGGGARLEGLCDVAEAVLRCQTFIALPAGIRNWPEEILDPAWTAAAGLAMYSAKLKTKQATERRGTGLLGRVMS
jgi:cell division protein FtsA